MGYGYPHGAGSIRCHAKAKATGERCTKWAVRGGTVCWQHGGASPTVQRKANMSVTLAQVDTLERRHPDEVLLDALHLHDVAVREDHQRLAAREANGEDVTDDRDELLRRNQTRLHMAATAITTRAAEKATEAYTRHLEIEGQLVASALDAIVRGLTHSLGPQFGEQLHTWALAQAHNVLVAAQDGEPAKLPDVESPPFALAAVTGEHDVAAHYRAVEGDSPYDVARLNDDALAELAGHVLDERNRRINAP